MELKGKNIVITGADGGMGQVLCEKLAKMGARLILCSVNGAALSKQCEKLKKEYG
ncbi:MAG TPA: NAD(P)-dependent oxidoreductase, partial [Clostridiales bacterium]|nr:NAD(P)-dependent oxidoreductase [Clostridiales bacterium]